MDLGDYSLNVERKEKMKKIAAFWKILNGKKTTIGALLMLVPSVLTVLGYGEFSEFAEQIAKLVTGEIPIEEGIGIIGAALASGGILHKLLKQLGK